MMSSKGWLTRDARYCVSIFSLILIVVAASFPALAQKGKQDQNADRDPAADYYNRGNERHKEGDLDGAIEDYTFAITYNSKFAMAWNNRGVIHYLKGDLDKAISRTRSPIAARRWNSDRITPKPGIIAGTRGSTRAISPAPSPISTGRYRSNPAMRRLTRAAPTPATRRRTSTAPSPITAGPSRSTTAPL